MENKKKITRIQTGIQIISALIWAAVILGCSYELQGTDSYAKIFNILIGGAVTHLLLLSSAFVRLFPKYKKDKPGVA